eukprot:3673099-Pleurochrysis_carterae.AAC.1
MFPTAKWTRSEKGGTSEEQWRRGASEKSRNTVGEAVEIWYRKHGGKVGESRRDQASAIGWDERRRAGQMEMRIGKRWEMLSFARSKEGAHKTVARGRSTKTVASQ